jgi:hypothetical protein
LDGSCIDAAVEFRQRLGPGYPAATNATGEDNLPNVILNLDNGILAQVFA